MKVFATINRRFEEVVAILEDSIGKEGVGVEYDFGSKCELHLKNMEQTHDRSATWVTAWSNFTYGFFANGEKTFVEFTGARNAYLSQDLLPSFVQEGEVIGCSGSHGAYTILSEEGKWDGIEGMESPRVSHDPMMSYAKRASFARGWTTAMASEEEVESCKGINCLAAVKDEAGEIPASCD